jgi:hypothetical protein
LQDFTDGATFRETFLGTAVTQRTDHVQVDGLDAVELSGPRADVFITASPPHQVLRVHLKSGAVIDGISDGDLHFKNFDRDFHTVAPTDVIDFSNLSTLPPVYSVVAVDTSGCSSPCAVSALLKNLGGTTGAQAPSTVTFSITDAASQQVLGRCQALVQPDVGFNSTTRVGCTLPGDGDRHGGEPGPSLNSCVQRDRVKGAADGCGQAGREVGALSRRLRRGGVGRASWQDATWGYAA